MSVTFNRPRRVGARSWLVSWSSDLGGTPTFYVYVDGDGPTITYETEYVVHVPAGESLHIDVFDDEDLSPARRWSGRLTLQWWMVDDTDHYRVEEYVGAAWVLREQIANAAQSVYEWRSRWMEDVTTHQFRVIAVGDNENPSTAASVSVLMVRNPDEPEVAYTYDSATGQVTIA